MKHLPDKKLKGNADVPERLIALNASQLHAVLCTVTPGSEPYASLVAYSLTADLKGLLFATPKATTKYRNILNNNNVSLLIDTRSNTKGDFMAAEAVTITGTAKPLRKGARREELADVLVKKHPGLAAFLSADDTSLVLVEISEYLHVTGFQSVTKWRP